MYTKAVPLRTTEKQRTAGGVALPILSVTYSGCITQLINDESDMPEVMCMILCLVAAENEMDGSD